MMVIAVEENNTVHVSIGIHAADGDALEQKIVFCVPFEKLLWHQSIAATSSRLHSCLFERILK